MKIEENILSNLKNFYLDYEDIHQNDGCGCENESNMAKAQVKSIVKNAYEVHLKLQEMSELPAWIQSKLSIASDYLTSVNDYLGEKD